MNHTQTAQEAMAQAAAGQAPEVQTEQTVQIGFEKALVMMNPNWRTELTLDQVNLFRHFYHRGVQDIGFLITMSNQNMQQNLDAVMHTVIVTGNEEQIAELQRKAQEEQAAEAASQEKPTKSRRTAKPHKAPASKSKAGSVAANRGAPKDTAKKAKK